MKIRYSHFLNIISLAFLLLVQTQSSYSQSGIAKSLKIGNKWIYHDSNIGNYYKEVTNDTLINGNKYAIILTQLESVQRKEYGRADSSKIFRYSTNDSAETPIIDFNLQTGDSLDKYIISSTNSEVFWNQQRKFICRDWDFFYLYSERTCFVEGIGMYSSKYSGVAVNSGVTTLKGAIIENMVYGDTTLTAICNYQSVSKPSDFILNQNYPNPFNSTTTIVYKLPLTCEVEINFYNIVGKKLKLLFKGRKDSGTHKVILDGDYLKSGIYIYEFKHMSIRICKKCTYIK